MKSEGLQEDRHSTERSSKPETGSSTDVRSTTTMKSCSTGAEILSSRRGLGVNFGKVKCKFETTWCVFEHHLLLSRANVQGVIDRWSQTWSAGIRHHNFPKVRVAWRIGLTPLVVRLRSNAARAIQNSAQVEVKRSVFLCARICLLFGQFGRFLILSSRVCSFFVASLRTCMCVSDLPFLLVFLVICKFSTFQSYLGSE